MLRKRIVSRAGLPARSSSSAGKSGFLARASIAALLAASVLAVAPGPRAFANDGVASASEMNGFGRIILTLPKPIEAAARSSNGILVVTFAEPVDFDYTKLPLEAPEYIAVVRRDPDGRTLRFAMTRPFSVDLKPAGEKVFIDLLPESWQGLPPGLPSDVVAELAQRAIRAEEAERQAARAAQISTERPLGVRVGTAPTFSRIVFDADIVVPVQFTRSGDIARLVFDAALTADAGELRATLAGMVTDLSIEKGEKSLTLVLNIPAEKPVKGFREDDSFVLDIIDPEAERLKKAEDLAAAAQNELKAKQARDAAEAAAKQKTEKIAEAAVAEAKPAPELSAAGSPADHGDEPSVAGPVEVTGSVIDENNSAIAFDFGRRVPAAVFGSNDALWMVFDTDRPINVPVFADGVRAVVPSLISETIGDVQVVRVGLTPGAVPSVKSTDDGWVLHIGPDVEQPLGQLTLRSDVNDQGRSVVSSTLTNAGKVVWLDNAGSGERYAVVLSPTGPSGLPKSRRFVEFTALRSLHGLAFAQIADDLTVTAGLDEVVVSRGQGLAVTQDQISAAGMPDAMAEMMITPDAWYEDIRGKVRDREKELFQAAANAPQRERSQARKVLADFYLANDMAAEAIGVLETMMREDPAAAAQPQSKFALGMAYALAQLPDDAVRIFSDKILTDLPETEIWRGYMAARAQNWQKALVSFRKSLAVLDKYPERLQALLRPMVVNAAIEADDYNFAGLELDKYDRLRSGTEKGDLANLLRGRISEASGRVDDALALYNVAAQSTDREVEARARLFRALLNHKEKRVEPALTEAELETIGLIWRNDELELRALDVLSGLYAGTGRWREAFTVTRRALEINSEHPIARGIQDKMAGAFEELFLKGRADELDKLKALALYYDFRNFTPPGRKGDEIVRRLADRLIALDLMEEAALLLQHQVSFRLEGAARASVATKLAVVYLQDAKPVEALRVLKDTRLASIPEDLKRARALIEARALAELTRTDLAIEMIANQTGPEVDRLRADIYWSGKRWRDAGEAYELVAGESWRNPAMALTDQQRSDVMRAAIAYVLADEGLSLSRLTSKFAEKMSQTPDANAFSLVSSGSGAKQSDFRDIARVAISSSTMIEFLKSYRERYPDQAGPEPVRAPVEAPAAPEQAAPQPLPEAARPDQANAAPGDAARG